MTTKQALETTLETLKLATKENRVEDRVIAAQQLAGLIDDIYEENPGLQFNHVFMAAEAELNKAIQDGCCW